VVTVLTDAFARFQMRQTRLFNVRQFASVTDVHRGEQVDGVFGDIYGLVADAFEKARAEEQVNIVRNVHRVLLHLSDDAPVELAVNLRKTAYKEKSLPAVSGISMRQ